jgi:hypothetical protein
MPSRRKNLLTKQRMTFYYRAIVESGDKKFTISFDASSIKAAEAYAKRIAGKFYNVITCYYIGTMLPGRDFGSFKELQ